MVTPVSTWMPSRANTSATTGCASGSSGPRMCGPSSSTVTRTPNRATAWASSAPIGPPPITASDPGRVSMRRMSRLVQNGVSARPSIGGRGGPGAGVEHDALRRLEGLAVHLDGPRAGEPAVAADEPGARVLEPLDRDGVVPVVGGLVADPGVHGRPVGAYVGRAGQPVDPTPLGQRVGRADDHLARDAAVVRALAAHQPFVDPDHVEPRPGQLARRRLAARAEPDHHHVA